MTNLEYLKETPNELIKERPSLNQSLLQCLICSVGKFKPNYECGNKCPNNIELIEWLQQEYKGEE